MAEAPALTARLVFVWDLESRCNVDIRGITFRMIIADEDKTPKLVFLLIL